jgi:hypothetical protein
MRSGVLLTLVVYALVFSLSGCAAGERFGSNDSDDDDNWVWGVECEYDFQCDDADPGTFDFCDPVGECHNVSLVDTDTALEDPECESYATVGHNTALTFDVDAVAGELTHTAPLSEATVITLSFRDPARIRIRPEGKDLHGLMLVLLSDCANAAINRLAYGPAIYSQEIDGGDYYLAVFSDSDQTVTLDVHFLEVTTCDGAEVLETGELVDTSDGYADDFSGSCMPSGDQTGHRGDRVYMFTVPDGEMWDVQIDLFSGDGEPNHYLYLAHGCGDDEAVEIDCANEVVLPDCSEEQQDDHLRVSGADLESGTYYVFVDAMDTENYTLGEYRLEVNLQGGAPR